MLSWNNHLVAELDQILLKILQFFYTLKFFVENEHYSISIAFYWYYIKIQSLQKTFKRITLIVNSFSQE